MSGERRSRGAESKTRLLEAAARTFAEHGYHATKISEIVAQAGVSQPTFYAYFESKEALFLELVTTFRDGLKNRVVQMRVPEGSDHAQGLLHLYESVRGIFDYLAADPVMTRIGLLQAPDIAAIYAELAAALGENMQRAQALGWIRPSLDVTLAAEAVVGMIQHLGVRYLLNGEREPQVLATFVLEFVLRGTQTFNDQFPPNS